MLKVGITGGIGSGKSAASKRMAELGSYVFDADKEDKQILKKNERIQDDLRDQFGTDVMDPDNTINPKKLARVAFTNEEKQSVLNAIMHPYVFDAIDNRYDQVKKKDAATLFVVDAALLLVAGFTDFFNSILLITANKSIRVKRSQLRNNILEDQIEKRMSLQMPELEKQKRTHSIIKNNSNNLKLHLQLELFWKKLNINTTQELTP